MMTVGDLADLLKMALTHTGNPALRRIRGQATIIIVARKYLSRTIWMEAPCRRAELGVTLDKLLHGEERDETRPLDLTDPGTAHALLVALTLSLGLDPGEGGLGVAWVRMGSGAAWRLATGDEDRMYVTWGTSNGRIVAPTVATEPDPIKALVLAVKHVLTATP